MSPRKKKLVTHLEIQRQHSLPKDSPHKGWYSRGYLPHIDRPGLIQGITFRLADSLPPGFLKSLKIDLAFAPGPDSETRERIEACLDAGHGSCSLRDARVARVVEEAFLHFDGERYRLLAWVVMPNR